MRIQNKATGSFGEKPPHIWFRRKVVIIATGRRGFLHFFNVRQSF